MTPRITRSLLMISSCDARLAGMRSMVTGSGDLVSTPSEVEAVYCLGSVRITGTAIIRVASMRPSASFQRTRDMKKYCRRFISAVRLEQALAHVQHVVGPGRLFQLGAVDDLRAAIRVAPVQAQVALAAALGGAAAARERLPEGHAAFEAIGPGAVDFAVHVERRRTLDVD